MTTGGRAVRGAVAALVLVLLGAAPASAHAGLVRTLPADGAAASGGPLEVVLTFSGTVDPDRAVVLVSGPDGDLPAAGPVQVQDGVVTQPLAAASRAGAHVVRYRVVGADGHPITGETAFSLVAAAPTGPARAGAPPAPGAVSAPASSTGPVATGGEAPGPAAVAGVAVAAVAGAGGALALRRRTQGSGG